LRDFEVGQRFVQALQANHRERDLVGELGLLRGFEGERHRSLRIRIAAIVVRGVRTENLLVAGVCDLTENSPL